MKVREWLKRRNAQRRNKAILLGVMRATEFPGPDHVPVPKPPLGEIVILPTKEATE